MKIYLVRHGETSGDVKNIFGGEFDDSLTKNGRLQAHSLGAILQTIPFDHIFVSPKKRTRQTLKIIEKYVQSEFTYDNDLRVRNHYGIMTGMKESVAKKKYPHLVELLDADTRNTIEGGEGYYEFLERVMNAYNRMKELEVQSLLVITHRGFIRAIVREHFQKGNVKVNHSGYVEITIEKEKEYISGLVNAHYES